MMHVRVLGCKLYFDFIVVCSIVFFLGLTMETNFRDRSSDLRELIDQPLSSDEGGEVIETDVDVGLDTD